MKTIYQILLLIVIFTSLFFLKAKIINAEFLNLVPNPSFEEGSTSPNSWSLNTSDFCNQHAEASLESSWNSSVANTGSKSVGFYNISLPPKFTGSTNWISSDFINLSFENEIYKITAFTKASPGSVNLFPFLITCFYDESGAIIGPPNYGSMTYGASEVWVQFPSFGLTFLKPINAKKIKIAFFVNCAKPWWTGDIGCSGSIWFDDIQMEIIRTITVHNFEDLNKNSIQDNDEGNLQGWEYMLYLGSNCEGYYSQATWTNASGNILFKNIPIGDYSVKQTFWKLNENPPPGVIDAREESWVNTTPDCQNLTLRIAESPIVNFGNYKKPKVPYLSQLDPAWASQEYDHGNTIGPFFCGTTIGGCGCAITSSAMLLNYYGVTKSPTGDPTNPSTLNTWLKQNNGYAFGGLKWNSIASYSIKANQQWGTQKIKFTGVGGANNYSLLDTDLTNNSPPILEEPGHFIIATAKQSPTYAINDPAYKTRATLSAYSNHFLSTRRYEKTNTDLSSIYLMAPAPIELLITDQNGKRTGKDPQTGQILTEIPNSSYFLEQALMDDTKENPPAAPSPSGINTLVILTPPSGNFTLQAFNADQGHFAINFSGYDKDGEIASYDFNQTVQPQTPITYEIGYSPDPGSKIEVKQKVKIDVKPGSSKNKINLHSKFIPVAILTTPDFDSKNVDVKTIIFGKNKITPYKNKAFYLKKRKGLLLFFETKKSGIEKTDKQICLEGKTKSGIPFEGCDAIEVKSKSSGEDETED